MDALNPEVAKVVGALRDRFPSYVEATTEPPFTVWVSPAGESSPMYVIDLGKEFVFGVGRGGCRWELQFNADDLDFFRQVWDAVILGKVSEVFGPGRSRVQVVLPDGTTAETSQADVPRGCLPVPGWIRNKKRTVEYAKY